MYLDDLKDTLDKVDFSKVKEIVNNINKNDVIGIIGNGGSASTAEHMACDLNNIGYTAMAFTNPATITAIGNDDGFEHIFSNQIKNSNINILISISASGNSPNIINGVFWANELHIVTIGLTGFDGGVLKEMCDLSIHVPIDNYEIVEDIHLMISHMIKKGLKNKND